MATHQADGTLIKARFDQLKATIASQAAHGRIYRLRLFIGCSAVEERCGAIRAGARPDPDPAPRRARGPAAAPPTTAPPTPVASTPSSTVSSSPPSSASWRSCKGGGVNVHRDPSAAVPTLRLHARPSSGTNVSCGRSGRTNPRPSQDQRRHPRHRRRPHDGQPLTRPLHWYRRLTLLPQTPVSVGGAGDPRPPDEYYVSDEVPSSGAYGPLDLRPERPLGHLHDFEERRAARALGQRRLVERWRRGVARLGAHAERDRRPPRVEGATLDAR